MEPGPAAPAPGRGLIIGGPIATDKLDFQKLLECAICCDYLQVVSETPCCHSLFCKSCLAGWARSNTSCPGCRAKLQLAACLANVPIQRFVDSLPMECPFKPDGCGARPPRSELEKHKELCNYRPEKLAEQKKAKQAELLQLRRRVEEQEKAFRDKQASLKPEEKQAALVALCNDVYQLAVSLRAVGSFQEGAEVAERARALRAEQLGAETVGVAECVTLVGQLQKDQAQYERALQSFEMATKIYAKAGQKGPAEGECLLAEGDIYAKLAKYSEADGRYHKALEIVKAAENNAGLAAVLNSIGLVAKKRSEYDKALSAYSDAIKVLKVDDPLWSEVVSNLADVFRKLGRYEEARDLYLKSLQKLESMYGGNHPLIGEVANNLGMLCKKEGKYAEALEYYRTALKLARHFKGKDHPSVGVFLTNLGDIYRKKGDFKLAEGTYMEALTVLEKALGPNHIELADVLNSQGLVLKKRADYDGAEVLYKRAIGIVVKTFGEGQNYKQGIYENNLADCSRKRTKFDEALTMYKHALGIIQLKLGAAHSEAAEVMHNMGLVQHQLGKFDEAIKLYDEALRIVKKEFGDRHYKVGMFLNSSGLARAMMHDYAKAYDELKQSSQILIQCLGLDHIEVADTYTNLGDVCMKLVTEGKVPAAQRDIKLQEAKKYYTEASRIVGIAFGPEHTKAKQLASLLFIVDNFSSLT